MCLTQDPFLPNAFLVEVIHDNQTAQVLCKVVSASSADLRTHEEEQPFSGNVQPRKKEDCRYLESYRSAVRRPSTP